MTRLYLAGPMSSLPSYNFPAFDAAAKQLREAGHEVFNPAENDRENGFDATGLQGHEAAEHGFDLRTALKQDLSWICDHAEGIALLEGWENSNGARAEVALGRALNIPARRDWTWTIAMTPPRTPEGISFKLGQGIVIEPVTV